ncbi:MAG: hypothetical protein ACTSUE_17190 [Promethearchaeota archaeon]
MVAFFLLRARQVPGVVPFSPLFEGLADKCPGLLQVRRAMRPGTRRVNID